MAKKKGAKTATKSKVSSVTKSAGKDEDRKKSVSRTVRAGLCTSVPMARKHMKFNWAAAVSADADIVMAATQEWVMRQVILAAAQEAGEKKSVLANDIEAARKKNKNISRLLRGRVGAVYVK